MSQVTSRELSVNDFRVYTNAVGMLTRQSAANKISIILSKSPVHKRVPM